MSDEKKMRPNSFAVPNIYVDQLMDLLTPEEWKVLIYFCRRIFGFQKNRDNITLLQISEGITKRDGEKLDKGTGLSRKTIQKAIGELVYFGIVVVLEKNDQKVNLGPAYTLQDDEDFIKMQQLRERATARESGEKKKMSQVRKNIGQVVAQPDCQVVAQPYPPGCGTALTIDREIQTNTRAGEKNHSPCVSSQSLSTANGMDKESDPAVTHALSYPVDATNDAQPIPAPDIFYAHVLASVPTPPIPQSPQGEPTMTDNPNYTRFIDDNPDLFPEEVPDQDDLIPFPEDDFIGEPPDFPLPDPDYDPGDEEDDDQLANPRDMIPPDPISVRSHYHTLPPLPLVYQQSVERLTLPVPPSIPDPQQAYTPTYEPYQTPKGSTINSSIGFALTKPPVNTQDWSWLPEHQRPLAQAFVESAGENYYPTKQERKKWYKILNEWTERGFEPEHISKAVQTMRKADLTIGGPQSVTKNALNVKATSKGKSNGIPKLFFT